jgi:hypothetical protein
MIACAAAALMLAACGSDTLSTSGGGGGGGGVVSAIAVTSSLANIVAGSSTGATITATATDSSGTPVAGATITFTSSAGTLASASGVTSATGTATTTLTAGTAASGTVITVTGTDGTITGNATVSVGSTQQSITLVTSLPQIPSDGSKAATITAVVRNAANNFVSGVVVDFTATAGGGLTVTQGTTDASGTAIATLAAVSDASNPVIQTVTVTATAGGNSAIPLPVAVTGTTLNITGPPSLVIGSMGSYTVSLVNSSGGGIANATVALASKAGNTLSAKSGVTNAQGQVAFTLTATKSGADTITATVTDATGNSLAHPQAITISSQSFAFTTPLAGSNNNLDVNVPQTLTVTLKNSSGAGVNGQPVSFAATRGTLTAATPTTDATGNATVVIASAVAGPAIVTATAGTLTSQVNFEFLATTPATVDLQASPATIATQGQSVLTAVVRDASENLVEGQTVNFATVDDITGGSLSVATAQTDSQGRAQTVYTASTTPSGTSGVNITATVPVTPAITGSTNITVGGNTVFLSMGTGNTISENADKTQFLIPYTIEALDAAGSPVSGVSITLKVYPLYYGKGEYTVPKGATEWTQGNAANVAGDGAVLFCPNEDDTSAYGPANFNGVLDPGEDGCTAGGLDLDTGVSVVSPYSCNAFGNGNGRLDPGGTAIAVPGTLVSASDGSGNFNIVYPEDQADWVTVQLEATATVAGSSNTAVVTFTLPILASYLTTLTSSPPGVVSPYGVAGVCTDPN